MGVTVAEIAAFLGLSTSRVRHVIRDNGISPVGRCWRAKLYDAREVLRHTGTHDRVAHTVTTAAH